MEKYFPNTQVMILLSYKRWIKEDLGIREKKANIVSQQCVVYIYLNVTCAMRVMLATRKSIYIRTYKVTVKRALLLPGIV